MGEYIQKFEDNRNYIKNLRNLHSTNNDNGNQFKNLKFSGVRFPIQLSLEPIFELTFEEKIKNYKYY